MLAQLGNDGVCRLAVAHDRMVWVSAGALPLRSHARHLIALNVTLSLLGFPYLGHASQCVEGFRSLVCYRLLRIRDNK